MLTDDLWNTGQHMSTTTKIFTAVIPRIHGTSVVTEDIIVMVQEEDGTLFKDLESVVPFVCSYSIVWWWSVVLSYGLAFVYVAFFSYCLHAKMMTRHPHCYFVLYDVCADSVTIECIYCINFIAF